MFKKKKVTDELENEFILLHGECDNCGSPLKYNKVDFSCKCDYCGTEYYVTQNGELEGQLIRFNIHGELKEFYIAKEQYHKIYNGDGCYRTLDGKLVNQIIATKMELKLIEI